jgi:hypothetical protein
MTPDGSEKKVLIAAGGSLLSRQEFSKQLVWSPDMRYIAYHSRSGMKGHQNDLYVHDLKTKVAEKIFGGLDLQLISWKSAPQ